MQASMVSPVAPAPPKKDPRRLATVNTISTNDNVISITNDLISTWENAIQLYQYSIHDEQWQIAAEDFALLAGDIESSVESSLCLLNAAIIFSKIGVHAAVSRLLDEAEPSGSLVALVMFVIAYAELHQENFGKAEECFKVALAELDQSSHDYRSFGLDFTLNTADVRYNLFILKTTKKNRSDVLDTLGSLPIEGLFAAPSRSEFTTMIKTKKKDRLSTIASTISSVDGSLPTPSLTNDSSRPSSAAASPIGKDFFKNWHDDGSFSSSYSDVDQKSVISVIDIAGVESDPSRWSGNYGSLSKFPASLHPALRSGNPYGLSEGVPRALEHPQLRKRKSRDEHEVANPGRRLSFEPYDSTLEQLPTSVVIDFTSDSPSIDRPDPPSKNPQRNALEPMLGNMTLEDEDTISPIVQVAKSLHSRHDSAMSVPQSNTDNLSALPTIKLPSLHHPHHASNHTSIAHPVEPIARPRTSRKDSGSASVKSGKSQVSKIVSMAPSITRFSYTWKDGITYTPENPRPPKVHKEPSRPPSMYASHSFFATWGDQMGQMWDRGARETVGNKQRQQASLASITESAVARKMMSRNLSLMRKSSG